MNKKLNNHFSFRVNNEDTLQYISSIKSRYNYQTTSKAIAFLLEKGIEYDKLQRKNISVSTQEINTNIENLTKQFNLDKVLNQANTALLIRIFNILENQMKGYPYSLELEKCGTYDIVPLFIQEILNNNVEKYLPLASINKKNTEE